MRNILQDGKIVKKIFEKKENRLYKNNITSTKFQLKQETNTRAESNYAHHVRMCRTTIVKFRTILGLQPATSRT